MSISLRLPLALCAMLVTCLLPATALLHAQSSTATVASQVDRLLGEEIGIPEGVRQSTDEVFLRRAFLDVIGEPPTSDDVFAFSLDDRADKRTRLVQQLLSDDSYGKNWGRYWRDVIMLRRTEDRAVLAQQSLDLGGGVAH